MNQKPLDDLLIPDWAVSMVNRWRHDAWPISTQGNGVTFEATDVETAEEFSDDAARRGHYINAREGRCVTIFRGRAHREVSRG